MDNGSQDVLTLKIKYQDNQKVWQQKKTSEKDTQWCDYYNRVRHTKDTCWRLDGKTPLKDQSTKAPYKKTQALPQRHLNPNQQLNLTRIF